MYIILWEYHVKSEQQAEFERVYASDGAWAKLFKNGAGYLGTELLRSAQQAETYVTIDKWTSQAAYESFLQTWNLEYKHLDEQCNGLTQHEQRLGNYSQVLA